MDTKKKSNFDSFLKFLIFLECVIVAVLMIEFGVFEGKLAQYDNKLEEVIMVLNENENKYKELHSQVEELLK